MARVAVTSAGRGVIGHFQGLNVAQPPPAVCYSTLLSTSHISSWLMSVPLRPSFYPLSPELVVAKLVSPRYALIGSIAPKPRLRSI
jgi:hypothetical protein